MVTIQEVPDRAGPCAVDCAGEVCAGGRYACGSCCRCQQRCAVTRVTQQLNHTLVQAAAAERVRQQQLEGWTFEHDDAHAMGQLAQAAAAYAWTPDGGTTVRRPHLWPWPTGLKLAGDRQRELVKAVALLMAEWDRLERDRLATESMTRPVLVPRELCTGDQEIWHEGSAWCLQVFECEKPEDGYRARVYVDGPTPILAAETAPTPRRAVHAALVQSAAVDGADAERIASAWLDVPRFPAHTIRQAPSRGYHPDQAVVQESSVADPEGTLP
jgi:hypothetical protein